MIKGRVHSIETMGLFDGPGVRTVFFMQGCPLKCTYCHNPDSQCFKGGTEYTVEDIVNFAKRYKSYYKNKGGVTFSGGEALMQGEFVYEAMKALKSEGIHTALDTSGVGQTSFYSKILSYTDLLILDIKHFDKKSYRNITGVSMKWSESFMTEVNEYQGKLWLRHVMMPGVTDNVASMDDLYEYISKWSEKIEKIEILPYHKLGIEKYRHLKLTYSLEDMEEMDKEDALTYQKYLMDKLTKDQMDRPIAV